MRNGIRYINDSAATTPESVIRALSCTGKDDLVLVAGGGGHKEADYGELASAVTAAADLLVVFRGDDASARLEHALSGRMNGRISRASDMEEAVRIGIDFLLETGGGTLLLSPGCSGAPLFTDLFHRGALFDSAVGSLSGGG